MWCPQRAVHGQDPLGVLQLNCSYVRVPDLPRIRFWISECWAVCWVFCLVWLLKTRNDTTHMRVGLGSYLCCNSITQPTIGPSSRAVLGATVHLAMGQTVCFISFKMHYRLCLYYCFSVKELLLPTNSEAQITIMFKKQMFPKNHTHFSEKLKNWKNHTHFSENSRFPRIVHLSRQERTRYVSKIQ